MVSPEKLVRKHLRNLKAYSSARDEYTGSIGVFLDANENALGSASANLYNRYPDPHHKLLRQKWAAIKGLKEEQIFFGNGSDEPIDLLIRLFCEPAEDYIITLSPTYGMYEVSAEINAVRNLKVALTPEFQIDLELLRRTWDEQAKLIFLCSPNNPTGNLIDPDTIEAILSEFRGIVVVDEAYIDFALGDSWSKRIGQYPNLVVLQTMSKAWGMAGIRVGVAMGDPYVISMLEKIKPPYNLSLANQRLALEALENEAKKDEYVAVLLRERSRLVAELEEMEFVRKVFPSDANFLLVAFENAGAVFEYLIGKQVIVRDRSRQLHCEGCLRITVGTPEENDQLITLLEEF